MSCPLPKPWPRSDLQSLHSTHSTAETCMVDSDEVLETRLKLQSEKYQRVDCSTIKWWKLGVRFWCREMNSFTHLENRCNLEKIQKLARKIKRIESRLKMDWFRDWSRKVQFSWLWNSVHQRRPDSQQFQCHSRTNPWDVYNCSCLHCIHLTHKCYEHCQKLAMIRMLMNCIRPTRQRKLLRCAVPRILQTENQTCLWAIWFAVIRCSIPIKRSEITTEKSFRLLD
jgi:hypothetical protein